MPQYWSGPLFALLFLLGYTGLVIYMMYRIISQFALIVKQKRLKIPTKAKAYSCDMRFEELENDTIDLNVETASTRKVLEQRNTWLENVNNISETKIKDSISLKANDEVQIQLREGIVHIRIGGVTIQYYGTNYRAINLNIRTESKRAIEKLIETGHYPCWTFFWELESEIEVKTLVNKIYQKTGRTSSESGTSEENGIVTMQANYDMRLPNGYSFRVFLNDKNKDQNGRIGIIHSGHPSSGFYNVKFLSMGSLLLLLYDAVSIKKFIKKMEQVYSSSKSKRKIPRIWGRQSDV